MKRTTFPALICASLVLALSGCMSVPDPASIPESMSIAELNQKGQTAFDSDNYRAAEVYYQLIISRYGSDIGAVTGAEFEIAHLRVRKGKWTDAKQRLETIIARYSETGGASLPPEYLVLARNDLERVNEKLAPKQSPLRSLFSRTDEQK